MQRKALSSSPPEGSKVMQEQPRATPGREIILFTELEKEESKLRHSRTWEKSPEIAGSRFLRQKEVRFKPCPKG